VLILGVLAVLPGCNTVSDLLGGDSPKKSGPPPGPPGETAEQALKRMQTEECKRLSTQPDTLLETSDLKYYDKGIINDYRQLVGVTVLNKARYCAVRSAQGDVQWLDAQGARFGSTPFTLGKSIPAGATQRFSTDEKTLTSGTIQGGAVKAKIAFTRVDVIEPP
jgi:hypothetical protein